MFCWSTFLPVPALRSTCSAAGSPALFHGFVATMAKSDFSGSCIIGFDSSSSRCGPADFSPGQTRDLPVPAQGTSTHARSPTAPGRPGARNRAPGRVALHQQNGVGTRFDVAFAAQWLAYAIPYRRFAGILTDTDARLGADVVCYSFIVVDLHHLLLAGLPAHSAFHPLRTFKLAHDHHVRRRLGSPLSRGRRTRVEVAPPGAIVSQQTLTDAARPAAGPGFPLARNAPEATPRSSSPRRAAWAAEPAGAGDGPAMAHAANPRQQGDRIWAASGPRGINCRFPAG